MKLSAGNLFVAKLGPGDVFDGDRDTPVVSVRKEQEGWIAALWLPGAAWTDVGGAWPTREEAQRALVEHCASVLPARWWPFLHQLWP